MPRGIPRTAQNSPVNVSNRADSQDLDIGQGPERTLKSTGDASDAMEPTLIAKVGEHPYDGEKMAMLVRVGLVMCVSVKHVNVVRRLGSGRSLWIVWSLIGSPWRRLRSGVVFGGCLVAEYVESEADHNFTAFLAHLTPGQVLKDRSAMFSKPERKRERFFRQRSKVELEEIRRSEVYIALQMAREMKSKESK